MEEAMTSQHPTLSSPSLISTSPFQLQNSTAITASKMQICMCVWVDLEAYIERGIIDVYEIEIAFFNIYIFF